MKTFMLFAISCLVLVGCARVQVSAPKEPIKVDISMRLDVYQHVEQDIDDIENIVSGGDVGPGSKIDKSLLNFFVKEAYAGEGLSPEVEQAALRRRDRRVQLNAWLNKGVLGENKSGLVEIRDTGGADSTVSGLVDQENQDRMVIYKGVAQKNGTSVGEVQKMYAKRLQSDAPAGTPIEALNASDGSYAWKVK